MLCVAKRKSRGRVAGHNAIIFSGNLRQKKLHSVYLVFLDTDIAEPENACSVETLKLWEKSQSNLGIPACAKEISLV